MEARNDTARSKTGKTLNDGDDQFRFHIFWRAICIQLAVSALERRGGAEANFPLHHRAAAVLTNMPSSWIVLNAKKPNATPLKCALIIMAAVLTSGDSPVAAHGSAIAQRQDGPAFSDVRKGDSTTSAKGMEGKGWLVGVFGTRRSLMTLALGQVITLFTAGTGICSQYLAQEGVRLCSPARH